jgi:outer membrane protein assembly factor BamE (lipoprotein component of BamABCDE complex)
MGMVKSEVLAVAGSPHWSDRWNNHDRWIYYMKPEDKQTERIVYFKKGRVVLTGERIKPALTAEEMDGLKKPKPTPQARDFEPSLSEDELRKVIKKEIRKQNKTKEKPQFETI